MNRWSDVVEFFESRAPDYLECSIKKIFCPWASKIFCGRSRLATPPAQCTGMFDCSLRCALEHSRKSFYLTHNCALFRAKSTAI
jgi:hypothetical protein